MGSSLWPPSWQWHLVLLRSPPSLDLAQMLRPIPGTDTTDTDTGRTDMDTTDMATDTDTTTDTGHTAMDTTATDLMDMDITMERGLLMLSPLPMLLPALRPRLIPGTDTTDTGHTAMDTTATDLMDM